MAGFLKKRLGRRTKTALNGVKRQRRSRLLSRKPDNLKPSRRKIARVGQFSVYIVECSDGSYYTGYTKDLRARLKLHNSGRGSKYVRGKRPVRLVFFKKYRYYKHAVTEERRIKTLTRKQKDRMVREGRISKRQLLSYSRSV
jgi:putative endonuclease